MKNQFKIISNQFNNFIFKVKFKDESEFLHIKSLLVELVNIVEDEVVLYKLLEFITEKSRDDMIKNEDPVDVLLSLFEIVINVKEFEIEDGSHDLKSVINENESLFSQDEIEKYLSSENLD